MGIPTHPEVPQVPKCPVCGELFARSNLVLCKACQAPHHRKCWTFNKGCATYACHGRTFVLPPVASGDELEFSARGRPNMLWVMVLVPTFLVALMGTTALLPKAIAEMALAVLVPGYVAAMLGATLGPLLTEWRYRLDSTRGTIDREIHFGPVRVQLTPGWKSFQEVEELEVTSAKSMAQKGEGTIHELEVWLRDKSGARHLLDRSPVTDKEGVLLRAEAAAEALDTTLGLPRDVEPPRALPPGLGRALRALPKELDGDGALPAPDPRDALPPGPDDDSG